MAADGSIIIDTRIDTSGMKDGIKEIDKGLAGIQKTAKVAFLGMAGGITALVAGSIKAASSIEDITAAFTPLVGGADNARKMVQALNDTAATTPFQLDDIAKSAKQLLPILGNDVEKVTDTFRMLGDTAGGNAQKLDSITRGYSKAMLKGKVDMESLNMIAEAGVPIYSELADSMGVSVKEMMELSSQGEITSDDLTGAFQKMTSEGGIFFNGMTIASQTLSGKISTMKDNFIQSLAAIGQAFLPVTKEIVDKVNNILKGFKEWTEEGDNLNNMLEIIGYTLAGLAAGVATFLLIFKGGAAIQGVITAFRALNVAMAANPFGALAVAITAILIPALIWLIKNWDKVRVYIDSWLERTKQGFILLGNIMQERFTTASNSIKIAMLKLAQVIANSVLDKVKGLISLLAKIPGSIGKQFKKAEDFVNGMQDGLNNMIDTAKEESRLAILLGKQKRIEAEKNFIKQMALIKDEEKARLDALKKQEEANKKEIKMVKAKTGELEKLGNKAGVGFNKSFADANEESTEESTSSVKDWLKNVGSAIQKGVQIIKKIVSTAWKGIQAVAKFDPQEAFDSFKELLDGISNFFMQDIGVLATLISSQGETLINDFLTGLIKGIPSIIKSMGNLVKLIINVVRKNKNTWLSAINTFVVAITETILDNLPDIVALFIDLFLSLLKTIDKGTRKMIPAISKMIAGIVDVVLRNLPEFIDLFLQITETLVKLFVDLLPKLAKAILKNLPSVFKAIVKLAVGIIDIVTDNISEIIVLFVTLVRLIVEALLDNIGVIISAFIEINFAIIGAIVQFLPEIVEAFIELIPLIIEALILATPKLLMAFGDIVKAVVLGIGNGFKTLGSQIFEIGKSIFQGIADGVKSGSLWDSIKKVFDDFVNSVKKFFGIASPSKMFAGFGNDIIQGMINGIISKGGDLLNAAQDVFGDFGDAAGSGFEGIQSGFENIGDVLTGKKSFEEGVKDGWDIATETVENIGSSIEKGLKDAGDAIKNFFGFANGGIVPGDPSAGDSVPSMLTPGEIVLNKSQQANLWNLANGKGLQSVMSGLGGFSAPSMSSFSTGQPIVIHNKVEGVVMADEREIGRIAFENVDRFVRGAYGNV